VGESGATPRHSKAGDAGIKIVPAESEFVTALIAAANRWGGHADRAPSEKTLLGDRQALASLVDTLFWASLAAEEGRHVRGSICICSRQRRARSRALQKPVPVTIQFLTRLLTASPEVPLAVDRGDDGLMVSGFLDSRPVDSVALRIIGPGTVLAATLTDPVAPLKDGRVHVVSAAGSTCLPLLLGRMLGADRSFPERVKLGQCLAKVTVAAHGLHHGGAILIAPESGDGWRESVEIPHEFAQESARVLRDLLAAVEASRTSHGNLDIDANVALLYASLRNIGQLTAIDGALALREDLTLLGFGAKFNCKPADFRILRYDAITGERQDDAPLFGGMRHQSAARLVHRHPDCAVVVSSQDGRLTLFAWVRDPGTVVAVSGLEHFAWSDT
jgi:hypothetical protein